VLFPPLCHLEVVGIPAVVMLDKKQVLVMPIKVNLNQKLMTIEEILGRRKQIALSIGFGVINDVDFDMRLISRTIAQETGQSDSIGENLKNVIKEIKADVKEELKKTEGRDAEWFNNDDNLNTALKGFQELKKKACMKFIKVTIDDSKNTEVSFVFLEIEMPRNSICIMGIVW
jgi:hypothetical protein